MRQRLQNLSSFFLYTDKGHYTLLVLFGLLAHGFLLLNDGVYWDGWLIYVGKLTNRWELISGIYADRGGLPIYTAFHWLLYQFPFFVFGYKLVAFLFILSSSQFIYRIARFLFSNALISLFIALFALTYPANQATVELIVIPYLLSYFLFWLGCLLLVLAQEKKHRAFFWHLGAVLCLVLSFRMYSLLVYFYGFLFILYLIWLARQRKSGFLQKTTRFVTANLGYLLLPIFFWLGNAWIFPPAGPYANVDAFIWRPVLVDLTGRYFSEGILGQFAASLANLANPLVLVSVVGLSYLAVCGFSVKNGRQQTLQASLRPAQLILAGAVLFAAGVFPYVIVGRSTMLHGWATRNAVLIAVPIAILLVGAAGALLTRVRKIQTKTFAKAAVFAMFALALLFATESAKAYLSWQLRAIKDNSVIANVARQAADAQDVSVFYVYDSFRVGGETKYRPHEYFGMLAVAFPGSQKIGFDVNYYTYEEYFLNADEVTADLLDFWYPYLDFYGCQAELHIEKGSAAVDPGLFLKYFYYRYLDPQDLDIFLYTVTEVEIIPFESPLATNCLR